MQRTGPGEFTLVAIALFGIGGYTVAVGSASGQGTLVAVGVFAFTLFTVGLVWPWAALGRVEVFAAAPRDATVGDVVSLRLRFEGRIARVEVRALDPAGEWHRASAPGAGALTHVATRRGVFSHVRVELRTSVPLGVFVRRRVLTVALPTPVAVWPRPLAGTAVLEAVPGHSHVAALASSSAAGDAVRSVREYVAGDAARLVHWPTSARLGELVVREHEPPAVLGVALVVDLRGDRASVERAASRAAGIGLATLRAGGRVLLATCEANGPVLEAATSRTALGRRLAAAQAGAPPQPPDGWSAVHVRATDDSRPS